MAKRFARLTDRRPQVGIAIPRVVPGVRCRQDAVSYGNNLAVRSQGGTAVVPVTCRAQSSPE